MKPKRLDVQGISQRQRRVAEEIRHALSFVLQRGELVLEDVADTASITVTEVRISPDLKNATAFVMPLAGKDREPLLKALKLQAPALRHAIGQRLTLKHTPALRFLLDESFDQAQRIETLFQQPAVRRDLQSASDTV
jgi:ribosome-binding factor A